MDQTSTPIPLVGWDQPCLSCLEEAGPPVSPPSLRSVGPAVERATVSVALVGAGDLIRRGLQSLLEHHHDRVALVELEDLKRPYVVLVDLESLASHAAARVDKLVGAGYNPVATFGYARGSLERAELLHAGTRGHISMHLDAGRIVSSLTSLGQPPVTEQLLCSPARSPLALALEQVGCTPREEDVLILICRGLSNKEVAAELFLSINTVKGCIRAAYRKLGVDSRTRAVIWGVQHGA